MKRSSTRTGAAPRPARDGDSTRRRILAVALDLWRREGPENVGMRDIAKAAGSSLGSMYHHFDSKDAIAIALYDEHLARHAELAAAALDSQPALGRRIAAALSTGLDARAADRAVLLVLAKNVLDLRSPLSLFSPGTRALRERSLAIFELTATCDEVSDEMRPLLARALWALHLAVTLRFLLDESPGHEHTRALVRGAEELVPGLVAMVGSPLMTPLRERLVAILEESGVDL